jgi:uncharacterized protein (TIGR03083 family)
MRFTVASWPLLSYDRYCEEIVAQTDLLRSCIEGADRAMQPLPDEHFRELSAYIDENPAVLGPWLVEGAAQLADTLRGAGPDAQLWTPVPGGTTKFSARRFAHETVIHRADAPLAVGAAFTVDEEVAVDALDEWMELGSLPMHFEVHPWMSRLGGTARVLPRLDGGQRKAGYPGTLLSRLAQTCRGVRRVFQHDRPWSPVGEDEGHRGA